MDSPVRSLKDNYQFFVGEDVNLMLKTGQELKGHILGVDMGTREYLAHIKGDLVPDVYKFSEIQFLKESGRNIVYK